MRALINNLEIRGRERKTSQKGNEYVIVRVEDETGKPYELYDPSIDNFEFYKRGQEANFILDLNYLYGKWQVKVDSFTYTEED